MPRILSADVKLWQSQTGLNILSNLISKSETVQSNAQMSLNYQAHWMPFSANRNFHKDPRMIVGAKGSYLIDSTGLEVYDSL